MAELQAEVNGIRTQMGDLSLRMLNIEETRQRPQHNEAPSTIELGCANDSDCSANSYHTVRGPSNGDEK